MSQRLIANATAAVARVSLVPPASNVGFNRDGIFQFTGLPRTRKVCQAAGPNSTTAYAARVKFWFSVDGQVWDGIPLIIDITNTSPQASQLVDTPCSIIGASLEVLSGTITTTGADNGRNGVDADVEG